MGNRIVAESVNGPLVAGGRRELEVVPGVVAVDAAVVDAAGRDVVVVADGRLDEPHADRSAATTNTAAEAAGPPDRIGR